MHQHYYDTHTGTVSTWQEMAAPSARFPYGLGLNNDSYAASLGVYPYREQHENFDKLTHELVPDDAPVIEGNEAVLYFRAVALAPDTALARRKADAKAEATARRWEAETGGITLPDGTRLLTTREDQAVITGAVTMAMLRPEAAIDYKTASGAWATVDAATMTTMGLAVSAHVEACFSRERALHEAIEAAETIEALAVIDINAGWPSNE